MYYYIFYHSHLNNIQEAPLCVRNYFRCLGYRSWEHRKGKSLLLRGLNFSGDNVTTKLIN